MATSYSQALVATSITLFLFLLNRVNSTSFTFNNFEPDQKDLIFQGDACVSSAGSLQLTKVDEQDQPIYYSAGRALYAAPIRIWDNTSGEEASFLTSFTFVVKAPNYVTTIAEGFVFFLTAAGAEFPSDSTGGRFGLFHNNGTISDPFVAVEFDTHINVWDPDYRHIGIDISNITSSKTVEWNFTNGAEAYVDIRYRAATKTLTASFTYPSSLVSHVVTAYVDLKNGLPEWVSVGFSGSTGWHEDFVATHDVLSWSFTSTLENYANANTYSVMENKVHIGHRTA